MDKVRELRHRRGGRNSEGRSPCLHPKNRILTEEKGREEFAGAERGKAQEKEVPEKKEGTEKKEKEVLRQHLKKEVPEK